MDGFELLMVVINHELQYSVWPQERPLPQGWRAEGFSGERAACLAHIANVWKDIRPISLQIQVQTQIKVDA